MITEYVLNTKLRGKHVYVHIYCGEENQTKALLGKLIMTVGEYQGFSIILKVGVKNWYGYKVTCKGYLSDIEYDSNHVKGE